MPWPVGGRAASPVLLITVAVPSWLPPRFTIRPCNLLFRAVFHRLPGAAAGQHGLCDGGGAQVAGSDSCGVGVRGHVLCGRPWRSHISGAAPAVGRCGERGLPRLVCGRLQVCRGCLPFPVHHCGFKLAALFAPVAWRPAWMVLPRDEALKARLMPGL